jgi:hypothetical protein
MMQTQEKINYALDDYNEAKAYLEREIDKLQRLHKINFMLKDDDGSWGHAAALKKAAEQVAAARHHIEKEWKRFNQETQK